MFRSTRARDEPRVPVRDGEAACHHSKPGPRLSSLLAFTAILAAMLAATLLVAPSVSGQPLEEMESDLLHSDLPIFRRSGDNQWPQHYQDDDSFGCMSRVSFGDWAFRKHDSYVEDETFWYRFSNYGAFHCFANIFRADERSQLDGADPRPSIFAFLGSTRVDGRDIELWAVQIGVMPGSEYLLLSRIPAEGAIEKFDVLQVACPRAGVRDGGLLDILLTRYCSVDSRSQLIRLARRMAHRPPLGTLTLVPTEDEVDTEAPRPDKGVKVES